MLLVLSYCTLYLYYHQQRKCKNVNNIVSLTTSMILTLDDSFLFASRDLRQTILNVGVLQSIKYHVYYY